MPMIVKERLPGLGRDNDRMTRPTPKIAVLCALAAFCAVACSPALDWREFVPEDTDIRVSFPCRPDRQARPVMLAGATVRMEMLACSAGEMTFALAFADVADPTQVGPSLAALHRTAIANVQGDKPETAAFSLKDMTPNDSAGRLVVSGRLPSGARVREHAAFFARGMRVYQASVIGANPATAAVETFIGGLKFPH
jgi:hypothetical protein